MAAQQILVLFVQVRVLVGQQSETVLNGYSKLFFE